MDLTLLFVPALILPSEATPRHHIMKEPKANQPHSKSDADGIQNESRKKKSISNPLYMVEDFQVLTCTHNQAVTFTPT